MNHHQEKLTTIDNNRIDNNNNNDNDDINDTNNMSIIELFDSICYEYGDDDVVIIQQHDDNNHNNDDDDDDVSDTTTTTNNNNNRLSICYNEIQYNTLELSYQLYYRYKYPNYVLLLSPAQHIIAEMVAILSCIRLYIPFIPINMNNNHNHNNKYVKLIEMLQNQKQHESNPIRIVAIIQCNDNDNNDNDNNPMILSFIQLYNIHHIIYINQYGELLESMNVPKVLPNTIKRHDDLYILCTSGTTTSTNNNNIVKAVIGSHTSTLRRLQWYSKRFPYNNNNDYIVVRRNINLTFIDSITELLGTILFPPGKLLYYNISNNNIQTNGIGCIISNNNKSNSIYPHRITMLPSQLIQLFTYLSSLYNNTTTTTNNNAKTISTTSTSTSTTIVATDEIEQQKEEHEQQSAVVVQDNNKNIDNNNTNTNFYYQYTKHFKMIIISGEICPISIVHNFHIYFNPKTTILLNLYGQTESTGDIMYAILNDYNHITQPISNDGHYVAIGYPILPNIIKVSTTNNNNELIVQGNLANGYVSLLTTNQDTHNNNDDDTTNTNTNSTTNDRMITSRQSFIQFHTGDICFCNIDNGCYYIKGRYNDSIKINGIMTYLSEVEAEFMNYYNNTTTNHYSILSCCAVIIDHNDNNINTNQELSSSSLSIHEQHQQQSAIYVLAQIVSSQQDSNHNENTLLFNRRFMYEYGISWNLIPKMAFFQTLSLPNRIDSGSGKLDHEQIKFIIQQKLILLLNKVTTNSSSISNNDAVNDIIKVDNNNPMNHKHILFNNLDQHDNQAIVEHSRHDDDDTITTGRMIVLECISKIMHIPEDFDEKVRSFIDLGGDSALAISLLYQLRYYVSSVRDGTITAKHILTTKSVYELYHLLFHHQQNDNDDNNHDDNNNDLYRYDKKRKMNEETIHMKQYQPMPIEMISNGRHYAIPFKACIDSKPLIVHDQNIIYGVCQQGIVQKIYYHANNITNVSDNTTTNNSSMNNSNNSHNDVGIEFNSQHIDLNGWHVQAEMILYQHSINNEMNSNNENHADQQNVDLIIVCGYRSKDENGIIVAIMFDEISLSSRIYWKRCIDHGMIKSSPILMNDVLYVVAGNILHMINPLNGVDISTIDLPGKTQSKPAIIMMKPPSQSLIPTTSCDHQNQHDDKSSFFLFYAFSDWDTDLVMVGYDNNNNIKNINDSTGCSEQQHDQAKIIGTLSGISSPVYADLLTLQGECYQNENNEDESNTVVIVCDISGYVHSVKLQYRMNKNVNNDNDQRPFHVQVTIQQSVKVSNQPIFSSPIHICNDNNDDMILFGCHDGIVRCLRANDLHQTIWEYNAKAVVYSSLLGIKWNQSNHIVVNNSTTTTNNKNDSENEIDNDNSDHNSTSHEDSGNNKKDVSHSITFFDVVVCTTAGDIILISGLNGQEKESYNVPGEIWSNPEIIITSKPSSSLITSATPTCQPELPNTITVTLYSPSYTKSIALSSSNNMNYRFHAVIGARDSKLHIISLQSVCT